jgi:hypothetical protein
MAREIVHNDPVTGRDGVVLLCGGGRIHDKAVKPSCSGPCGVSVWKKIHTRTTTDETRHRSKDKDETPRTTRPWFRRDSGHRFRSLGASAPEPCAPSSPTGRVPHGARATWSVALCSDHSGQSAVRKKQTHTARSHTKTYSGPLKRLEDTTSTTLISQLLARKDFSHDPPPPWLRTHEHARTRTSTPSHAAQQAARS